MRLDYVALKRGSDAVRSALADSRSARNRSTRAGRVADQDAARTARHHKRRLAREDREREQAMNRRLRVQVAEADRPKGFACTPRALFSRRAAVAYAPLYAAVGRRSDGLRSVHFAFVARGFASTAGRRWRPGEMTRAALYTVREDALEAGEAGWWSNVAADRRELVAFCRTMEEVERHDRANANVYIAEVIALDATMTARQRRRVMKRLCADLERRGLAYVAGVQLPDASGDGRNFHVHLVYSLRPATRLAPYDWTFAVGKVGDLNTPAGIRGRRELVVREMNRTLVAMGSERRFTALSNRARGLADAPQPKLGQNATWVLRRLMDAEKREAMLDRLRQAATAIRTGLDLADRVAPLHRVVAAQLAAGQERVAHALDDTPVRLAAASRLVRRRVATAALPLTSLYLDQQHLVRLEQIATERRARRERLLAMRRRVAEVAAAMPSLDTVTTRMRLEALVDHIGAIARGSDRRLDEVAATASAQKQRQAWLEETRRQVDDLTKGVPTLGLQTGQTGAILMSHRDRLACCETDTARRLALIRAGVERQLLLARDRVEAVAAQESPLDLLEQRGKILVRSPARGPNDPRPTAAAAGSVDTGRPVDHDRAEAETDRLRLGQDIGRAAIDRERARRAVAERAASPIPTETAPREVEPADRSPGLLARIADRLRQAGDGDRTAKRTSTPRGLGKTDDHARPSYTTASGVDPARLDAIARAVAAIEVARSLPMRRAGSDGEDLEIVTKNLPPHSPLRAAAAFDQDLLVQAALRRRLDTLLAMVERHLAARPVRTREALFRHLHRSDPHAARDAVTLLDDRDIAAIADRVAIAASDRVASSTPEEERRPGPAATGEAAPAPPQMTADTDHDDLVQAAWLQGRGGARSR